jgi:hypothetical protein
MSLHHTAQIIIAVANVAEALALMAVCTFMMLTLRRMKRSAKFVADSAWRRRRLFDDGPTQ